MRIDDQIKHLFIGKLMSVSSSNMFPSAKVNNSVQEHRIYSYHPLIPAYTLEDISDYYRTKMNEEGEQAVSISSEPEIKSKTRQISWGRKYELQKACITKVYNRIIEMSKQEQAKPKDTTKATARAAMKIFDMSTDDPVYIAEDQAKANSDASICYKNMKTINDFYVQELKANIFSGGYSQNIMRIFLNSHSADAHNNAFWDSRTNSVTYGDTDPEIFNPFTKPLDITAHEFTHGFTYYTSNLDYEGQSGALNESISDAFGASIFQKEQKQKSDDASWLIGENLLVPQSGTIGTAMRSMKKPGTAHKNFQSVKDDRQPDHMDNYADLLNNEHNDNGGVHINSGIPNRAFYLVATNIQGFSCDKPMHIWHAAASITKPKATFLDFATTTIAQAGRLYGKSIENLVSKAWKDVGVLDNEGRFIRKRTDTVNLDNRKVDEIDRKINDFQKRKAWSKPAAMRVFDISDDDPIEKFEKDAKPYDDVWLSFSHMKKINQLFTDKLQSNVFAGNSKANVMRIYLNSKQHTSFNNAFWDSGERRVTYGAYDPKLFNHFIKHLDIAVHEFTHAFIQDSSNLNYEGQGGSLHCSIGDAFGVTAIQMDKKQRADEADWLIADGILVGSPGSTGTALRSLKQPGTAFRNNPILGDDPQIEHMRNFKIDEFGMDRVKNSGIPSKAFYLTSTGIQGYAFEKPIRIWHDAVINIKSNATFYDFAKTTITIAKRLYGEQIESIVSQSWYDVGVLQQPGPITIQPMNKITGIKLPTYSHIPVLVGLLGVSAIALRHFFSKGNTNAVVQK